MTTLADIKIKLEQAGFSGLYVPGDCGCELNDLAPCGQCRPDEEGWINDCEPGHVQFDPSGQTKDWVISGSKTPLTADEFKRITDNC